MEGLVEVTYGFIVDAPDNGLEVTRVRSDGGGRAKAGDLEV